MACQEFALFLESLLCFWKIRGVLVNICVRSCFFDLNNIPGRGLAVDGRVLAVDWRVMACKEFAFLEGGTPCIFLNICVRSCFFDLNKKICENTKKMKSLKISNIPGRGLAVDGRVSAVDWRVRIWPFCFGILCVFQNI